MKGSPRKCKEECNVWLLSTVHWLQSILGWLHNVTHQECFFVHTVILAWILWIEGRHDWNVFALLHVHSFIAQKTVLSQSCIVRIGFYARCNWLQYLPGLQWLHLRSHCCCRAGSVLKKLFWIIFSKNKFVCKVVWSTNYNHPPPPPPCSCRAGSVLSLCANITCLLSLWWCNPTCLKLANRYRNRRRLVRNDSGI